MKTIDRKAIMYLNLFEKTTRVRCKSCFSYNNMLIFFVPKPFVYRAVGENGNNIKELSAILKKRIKVVGTPEIERDFEKFIFEIISPITVRNIEINNNEIIISADMQSRASLIGRDKIKLGELSKIVREVLGRGLRIV